jgi:hypothetical protein
MVLQEADVSEFFSDIAKQQRLLHKQLEKINPQANIDLLSESFLLFAQTLEAICTMTE